MYEGIYVRVSIAKSSALVPARMHCTSDQDAEKDLFIGYF
jgi:hypothetical protein